MAFENSIRVLQSFAKKQVADAKKNLKGSNNLANKIKSQVIGNFDSEPVVRFTLPYYAGFVDTGVEGTGVEPKSENAQPLKMKTPLKSSFANLIFGYQKQPAFNKSKSMIPPKVLDKWVIKKGVSGTRNAMGRFISRNAIKFAMAVSIHRQGLEGTGFFSEPLGQNIGKMYLNLEGAYAHDLANNLIDDLV